MKSLIPYLIIGAIAGWLLSGLTLEAEKRRIEAIVMEKCK